MYTVSATLEREGRYHIAVQLAVPQDSPIAGSTAVAPLQCEVVCMPAAAAAQCCRIELPAEQWVAGRAAEVVVHQFDRQALKPIWCIGITLSCLSDIQHDKMLQGVQLATVVADNRSSAGLWSLVLLRGLLVSAAVC